MGRDRSCSCSSGREGAGMPEGFRRQVCGAQPNLRRCAQNLRGLDGAAPTVRMERNQVRRTRKGSRKWTRSEEVAGPRPGNGSWSVKVRSQVWLETGPSMMREGRDVGEPSAQSWVQHVPVTAAFRAGQQAAGWLAPSPWHRASQGTDPLTAMVTMRIARQARPIAGLYPRSGWRLFAIAGRKMCRCACA